MRRFGHLSHLPSALALLVPLLAVAVLGGLELSRQSAQVADAVQQQAATFLASARLHFEERVRGTAEDALHRASLRSPRLVAETLAAVASDEGVLDLFCLDGQGQLVHPRTAMPRESALPFLSPTTSDEIRLAEALLALGGHAELQRAQVLLQRFALRRPAAVAERARAAFRLGSVLRQTGDLVAAERAYLEARLLAAQSDASPIGVELLTRVAVAEMQARPDTLLDLARGICENEWFAVPDELAGAVLARILAELPEEAGADVRNLRSLEGARRTARRYAHEYQRFAAAAVERAVADDPPEPIVRVIGSGPDCALLALRRTTDAEQSVAGRTLRWLGLRLDLPCLVNETMDAFLSPQPVGFRLEVLDGDGASILDGASGSPVAAEVPTVAGLVLRAVPVDPDAALRDERAAVRNRVLILAALLALALGGGFLLVRSVGRETELADLKMIFVSRMSHELKTPLALIKMYGETLALGRAKDAAQTQAFGGIVAREADRLNDQIQRILSFAQQLSGTLRYTPEKVDLAEAVEDVIAEYRDHVHRSGCVLRAQIDESVRAVHAMVDPHALHLALSSLIDNAVKYTPKTQVPRDVVVALRREGDVGTITVRDHGIGIPDKERQRVFDPFYRASNAGEIRGAGLGLGQVQHFAEAHHGQVSVAAAPGGGTVVTLRLPLALDGDRP
ncbi:MAG: HAMP domain-containing sensor histidine kinase [Planctomycetota bacterium]